MILACGEALIDFTPIEINKEVAYVPKEGGSPYNVAITLGRLGTLCGFFGKISKDFFGEMLIEKLRNNHVDTSFVLRSEKSTTLAFVILKEGEPHFVFYGENTADTSLEEKDMPYNQAYSFWINFHDTRTRLLCVRKNDESKSWKGINFF